MLVSFVDDVFPRNQQAVAEEGAGWQGGEDKVVLAVIEADGPVGTSTEDTVRAGEQGAGCEDFPQATEHDEDEGEARAHRCAVDSGGQDGVFRGIGFGTGDDDAVGNDEREVDAKRLVKRVGQRLDKNFNHGHRARDEQDEDGDADFRTQPAAGGCDTGVGKGKDEDGGKAEADGVHGIGRGGEQRAEAEDLYQDGVVVPQAVGEGFAGFGQGRY